MAMVATEARKACHRLFYHYTQEFSSHAQGGYMNLGTQYKRAYNFGQKVVILATEQVGHIHAVRVGKYLTEFKVSLAAGVDVWKTREEIDDFDLWLEGKR